MNFKYFKLKKKMELHTRITLKQAIARHPHIAQGLKRNSKTFEDSIRDFAIITGVNENFLRLNIDKVRNWID